MHDLPVVVEAIDGDEIFCDASDISAQFLAASFLTDCSFSFSCWCCCLRVASFLFNRDILIGTQLE
jgi:hypothetical protein